MSNLLNIPAAVESDCVLSVTDQGFKLGGSPHQIISGSLCYFRMLPEQWNDRLKKLVALGANTVELYVPWNFHEPRPREYRFSGRHNLTAFLDLCVDHKLHVLFRPGPYICGEWEFGGLPWWLLRDPEVKLRSSDPKFLCEVNRWWQVLIPKILPYLSTRGGPIIAVQIENEYGYFGQDLDYLEHLRNQLKAEGVDVVMFTSDGPYSKDTLMNGGLPGVLRTANFGSDPETHLASLREVQQTGPLTCMEFWVGWFDAWGNSAKSVRAADSVAKDLRTMLRMGASVNLFMFAGGTSFGFMSGANDSEEFEPHVTSYDYDALLTEAGDTTPKYEACRKVIAEHLGRTDLQDIFTPSPTIAKDNIDFTECSPLLQALPSISEPTVSSKPLPLEYLGEGYGYVLYRVVVPSSYSGKLLRLRGMRDFAKVLADGKSIGSWYINDSQPEWAITENDTETQLDIIVDCMARPNFGHKLRQLKGISDGIYFGSRRHDERAVLRIENYPLAMENLDDIPWSPYVESTTSPCFYRAIFSLDTLGDTYLELSGAVKGFASINGFNLGRYWNIGPQYSLYIPKALLHEGSNELIVFDIDPSGSIRARLVTEPVFSLP